MEFLFGLLFLVVLIIVIIVLYRWGETLAKGCFGVCFFLILVTAAIGFASHLATKILSHYNVNVHTLLAIFVWVIIFSIFTIVFCVFGIISASQSENEMKNDRDHWEKMAKENSEHNKIMKASLEEAQEEIKVKEEIIDDFSSNITAFPYMAGIVADYETIGLERMASSLDWGSDKQRLKKVTDIRTLRKQSKELIEKYKVAAYQLAYLRELYPSLDEILDTEFSELKPSQTNFENVNADYDTVHEYLSKEEYWQLTETERNQLALDRYISSHRKTKWQIGRDYEMYVGYKYSLKGYKVSYYGIEKGMEDLGRDLILEKDGHVLVVQCKYWSSEKTIREKHILQLYGTYICYCLENNISQKNARCIFVTNIKLSEQAKEFAKYLGVGIAEEFPLGEYPRIKCNIGKDEYGNKTKIYHLPFDQQYDNTQIKYEDEFFAFTVAEAENKGFRRAFKHCYS